MSANTGHKCPQDTPPPSPKFLYYDCQSTCELYCLQSVITYIILTNVSFFFVCLFVCHFGFSHFVSLFFYFPPILIMIFVWYHGHVCSCVTGFLQCWPGASVGGVCVTGRPIGAIGRCTLSSIVLTVVSISFTICFGG